MTHTSKAQKLRSSNISLPVDKTSASGPSYHVGLSYLSLNRLQILSGTCLFQGRRTLTYIFPREKHHEERKVKNGCKKIIIMRNICY